MLLFGKRLKELRKSAKLTQQELGKLINVTKVSVCCYENGTRLPALDTMLDISNLFKVNLDYLIGNDSYVVSEDNSNYGIKMAKPEIEFIKEARKNTELYAKIIDNPKRAIELINKKMK